MMLVTAAKRLLTVLITFLELQYQSYIRFSNYTEMLSISRPKLFRTAHKLHTRTPKSLFSLDSRSDPS